MANLKSTLYVYYPPDFDGEFHVNFELEDKNTTIPVFKFEFRHSAASGEKLEGKDFEAALAWKLLVRAARAIVAQDKRRRGGE